MEQNKLANQWNLCLQELKEIMNDDLKFDTFYKESKLYEVVDKKATIVVEMQLEKMVLTNDKNLIKEVIEKQLNTELDEVEIIIRGQVKPEDKIVKPKMESHLNEELTFDNFIEGKSNKLAKAASLAVSINPGESFNPLYIYGEVGLGKTHLLNAIGNYIKENHQTLKVLYISILDLVNEYFECKKNYRVDEFNERYKLVDVILVDDIQYLVSKEKSQEVFFQIFNQMMIHKKQVVIASDRLPQNIKGLEQRFVSRFNSGLVVEMSALEYETALEILKRKMKQQDFNIDMIDDDVLSMIALSFKKNVYELEGAMNRLFFYVNLENINHVNMNVALEALSDYDSNDLFKKSNKVQSVILKGWE